VDGLDKPGHDDAWLVQRRRSIRVGRPRAGRSVMGAIDAERRGRGQAWCYVTCNYAGTGYGSSGRAGLIYPAAGGLIATDVLHIRKSGLNASALGKPI
jgi:hypothetical protein